MGEIDGCCDMLPHRVAVRNACSVPLLPTCLSSSHPSLPAYIPPSLYASVSPSFLPACLRATYDDGQQRTTDCAAGLVDLRASGFSAPSRGPAATWEKPQAIDMEIACKVRI